MPQYLIAGYIPDNFDPSQVSEATGRESYALNKEMIAAGVRKFACGLGSAKSLQAQTDGGVLTTDGSYLEAKEHIGGFWTLDAPTRTRRWHGRAKAYPPLGDRSRYGKSFQSGGRLATEPQTCTTVEAT